MPSPKAFLRDIATYKLDPQKAYTTRHMDSSGRVKSQATNPENLVKDSNVEASTTEEDSEKKASVKEESPVSHKKPATKPSHGKQSSKHAQTVATEGTNSVENHVEQAKETTLEVAVKTNRSSNT